MEELIITKDMRETINRYLGYELVKKNEVGHHIYDEAPGLGKIGIEGVELRDVVTNKQLDSNGNVEWYKNPNPKIRPGIIKPFHCKLTTISSKKAKILIASIFPEEAINDKFLKDNSESIAKLRDQLHLITRKKGPQKRNVAARPNNLSMKPNNHFLEGITRFYNLDEDHQEPLIFGPNNLPL